MADRVSATDAASYLGEYVRSYRAEWGRFTARPPRGGGYPALPVSVYLSPGEFHCYLATDGFDLASYRWQPEYDWWIAGGPALVADTEPTRKPAWVTQLQAPLGENLGLYRFVLRGGPVDDETWQGRLPAPLDSAEHRADADTEIRVYEYAIDKETLLSRLTFGLLCRTMTFPVPGQDSELWNPRIIRNLGFGTADTRYRRFLTYLELDFHRDHAAWDPRSIWARVSIDLRRDFAYAATAPAEGGGMVSFTAPQAEFTEKLVDRLSALETAISQFARLCEENPEGPEALFHAFLQQNPILLDVYASAESKPRFVYPEGESPSGKTYVEPDFVLRYTGQSYRLVELERPGKAIGTTAGHARAELTQAGFQIAEWKQYIANHYDQLKTRFPGISTSCASTIVISRESERLAGGRQPTREVLAHYRDQTPADELLLYDDLLSRAREAYDRLSAHALGMSSS
jgi:Domain of unknown function (DUF4263)